MAAARLAGARRPDLSRSVAEAAALEAALRDRSVAELARILRPGGEFRFVTDIADYAAWTLARLTRSPAFVWSAERAGRLAAAVAGLCGTRYQGQGRSRGPCLAT